MPPQGGATRRTAEPGRGLASVDPAVYRCAVPSDAVWTAVAAGGASVLSGGIGGSIAWIAAKKQADVELAKLAQEAAPGTARELKFRQDLYLEYLAACDAFFLFSIRGGTEWSELIEAFNRLISVDDRVELFANKDVIPARQAVLEHVNATWDAVPNSEDEWRARTTEPLDAAWDRYVPLRAGVIRAMRWDVGPEA